MAAVTERLVLRSSAPAEGNPVPDLVPFSVGGFYGDAASHPERPVLISGRVFNNYNGFIQFRLDRLAAFIISDYQPTRGAVARFFYGYVPGLLAF